MMFYIIVDFWHRISFIFNINKLGKSEQDKYKYNVIKKYNKSREKKTVYADKNINLTETIMLIIINTIFIKGFNYVR